MANSLIKKTGIYLVGNFASKLTSVLLIPLYAWFVTAEALGYYDYYFTIVTMVAPVCFVAIWESVLRYTINEKKRSSLETSISTVVCFLLIVIVLVVIIDLCLSFLCSDQVFAISSISVMIIVYGITAVWQYFARAFQNPKLYTLSGIIASILNFILIATLVCVLKLQLEGLIIAYVISQLAIVFVLEKQLKILSRCSWKKISFDLAKRYFAFSIPMTFNLLLSVCLSGFGRILVLNTLGADANGLYAFAMKFGSLIIAFGSIFSMAVIEEAILRIGRPGHEGFMGIVANNTLLILIATAAIALPAIDIAWPLLAGQEYAISKSMVPAFLVYGIFIVEATVVGNVFSIIQKTHLGALSMLAGCIGCILSSVFFLGKAGAESVAWSTAFGAFILFVTRYLIGKKYISYSLSSRLFVPLLSGMFIEILLFYFDISGSGLVASTIWLCGTLFVFLPFFIRGVKGMARIKDVE